MLAYDILSPEAREPLLALLVHMIWADNRVSPQEISAARGAAAALGLPSRMLEPPPEAWPPAERVARTERSRDEGGEAGGDVALGTLPPPSGVWASGANEGILRALAQGARALPMVDFAKLTKRDGALTYAAAAWMALADDVETPAETALLGGLAREIGLPREAAAALHGLAHRVRARVGSDTRALPWWKEFDVLMARAARAYDRRALEAAAA